MPHDQAISDFLAERIAAGDFPSAVYLVAERGEVVFRDAIGLAVVEPERIAARPDTIYDVASLTKPLVTGLIITRLVESGRLDPNEPVGDVLNELFLSACAEVTVNQLMMHTSGLPAWKPFYLLVEQPEDVLHEIAGTLPRIGQPPVTYSDLNFIILAAVIEQLLDKDFAEAAADQIFGPLGLKDTCFRPPADLRPRIAASEKGNEYEKLTCIEQGYLGADDDLGGLRSPFRSHIIWGEVHDQNAWFMGGAAGHAGLFSTADDVFRIALQFLPAYTQLLQPETCELFNTNFTEGLNEDRSFSFQLASTGDSTAGTSISPESFGHNGFTGTSMWIDPAFDRVFILLTNRTHNHELPFVNINSVRRRFHDLALAALDKNT